MLTLCVCWPVLDPGSLTKYILKPEERKVQNTLGLHVIWNWNINMKYPLKKSALRYQEEDIYIPYHTLYNIVNCIEPIPSERWAVGTQGPTPDLGQ